MQQNYTKAIELYKESVDDYSSAGMLNLSRCYYFGIGGNRNIRAAINLYIEATEYVDCADWAKMYYKKYPNKVAKGILWFEK